MDKEICWYKYKALTVDKNLICDVLQTTDCPKMSDACTYLENQGYNILSIKKVDYIHAISTFEMFTPVLQKFSTT